MLSELSRAPDLVSSFAPAASLALASAFACSAAFAFLRPAAYPSGWLAGPLRPAAYPFGWLAGLLCFALSHVFDSQRLGL